MKGLPVDVSRAPMSRREHTSWRLGCLGAVLAVLVLTIVFQFQTDLSRPSSVAWSIVLYLAWGAAGLDFPMLLESHEKYLIRYREKREAQHLAEAGAPDGEADASRPTKRDEHV